MATPLSADRFLAALRAEGVKVAERSGWRTHNRNSKGAWGPVNGIVIHHTAGTNSLNLCWSGTADLPGPLCHTHLAKTGVATMLSAGRANHAGTFAANAFNSMLNESSTHPRPDAAEPVDANARTYGIEIENLGNGSDPYPAAQYDQAVRWAAALCRAHGWTAHSVIGHKEGTRRKIDPSFDMDAFRDAVAARLAHDAGWSPGTNTSSGDSAATKTGDDDMPDYVNLGVAEPYELRPGGWDSIEFTREWSDTAGDHATNGSVWARGPARFTGTVSLHIEELPVGEVVQARMSEYEGDRFVQDHPIHEVIGTAGGTFAVIPLTKRIASGRGMRVRLRNYSDQPVTVSSAVLTVLSWKES
ncbi:N-acetylmuramoyl-L-alanine amidase [Streptomyces sp.]|uniref:N-acetylmuramoyl-L-alanine amidase n=1 Tax=Streptomyces sp. TaxID=1931 RepID=UPI0028115EE2|nr:N-acetylmuramoyl-L-alanine amidase [Streptomyces sp.]